jgi:hypothetical protein
VALCVALILAPSFASAQVLEVTPFVGYRFGGDLYEVSTGAALDIDGASTLGGTVDISVGTGTFVSVLYSHQGTRLDVTDAWTGAVRDVTLAIDHWHVGATQELDDGRVRPIIFGSAGLTRFGSAGDAETRFSLAAGGGVKVMPSRRVGVRFDGRVYAVFVDGRSGGVCSSGTCLINFNVSMAWQAEFTAGVVLAF